MQYPIYHIDAFTNNIFSGNPAAVCILPKWLPDTYLFDIAAENNLPVTVFLVRFNNQYQIRWITPDDELDICGHGSLAAAYVIFNYLEPDSHEVNLLSRLDVLPIFRIDDLIILNFPAKEIAECISPLLEQGLGLTPKAIYQSHNDRCIAIYDNEEEIKQLQPDMQFLKELSYAGIIVTAPSNEIDFVSRTFYPRKTIQEDQVTGASHCFLIPYWAKRLNKTELHAFQLSERGGELFCQYQKDRVLICGKAVLYLQGIITIEEEIEEDIDENTI